MDHFELVSEYKLTGNQPQAVEVASRFWGQNKN